MMGFGFNELLMLMLVIALLHISGLWPMIIRGLRELRGEKLDTPQPTKDQVDLCYKMLGLSSSAPWDEVEKAYRQKAKIHHPDHGGDGDTMRALNDAYTIIKRSRGR
jgi:hypothetical protein